MNTRTHTFPAVAAALLLAATACQSGHEFVTESFINFESPAVSVKENAGTVEIKVKAYPQNGVPDTEATFEIIDGEAVNGVDFSLVSPANGLLSFHGDSTAVITFSLSGSDIGIYTGRKNFSVLLTSASNGYSLGGLYSTTVTITDIDRDPDNSRITGTYTASGAALSGGALVRTSWEMNIMDHDTEEGAYFMDGIVPLLEGSYATYGNNGLSVVCYLSEDGGKITVPPQVCSSMYFSTYYLGVVPGEIYDEGNGLSAAYSTEFGVTFSYDTSSGTWISDYAVLLLALTKAAIDEDSIAGILDCVDFPVTFVKE